MNNNKDKFRLFNTSHIDENFPNYEDIMALHKQAIENNEDTYIDPATGYKVFTAKFLLERDYCCGCGCRHCPY
jgi:hypothetical protein